MPRRLLIFWCACVLGIVALAQKVPGQEPSAPQGTQVDLLPEPEPISPREALFLAIELRDLEAARRALRAGGAAEIALGDPSPLATAALHDDLRMVVLLLDSGGDPSITKDSPLEEAVRHENTRMVELLMRAGSRVPSGEPGQEMFRLAQRGAQALALTKILLDHDGSPDLCLTAAVGNERIDLIEYCLERGADVGTLPAELNALNVALRSGKRETVDRIVVAGLANSVLADALDDAIVAGELDIVKMAIASGAVPAFPQIEAAIESGHPEICLFLLEQSPPGDNTVLQGGDVDALIQRASDLGHDEVAAALRQRSGRFTLTLDKVLPAAIASLLILGVLSLLIRNLWRREPSAPPVVRVVTAPDSRSSASPVSRSSANPASAPPRTPGVGMAPVGSPARPAAPVLAQEPSPAATVRITPEQFAMAPAATPAPSPDPHRPVDHGWEMVAEPEIATPEPVGERAALRNPMVGSVAIEPRMPEIDPARDTQAVFAAARRAAAGEAVRPDAPDRRQIVLVTPARVTMLQSCPAPGTLAADETAAAEGIAPSAKVRNVAAIAYNDLDTTNGELSAAIPFFELLRQLGYLGHAVWIFEGHLSAMAAGCEEADVLIVDDGMVPYLPGNWRSVASRVMRGSDVYVYERKSDSLRKLA